MSIRKVRRSRVSRVSACRYEPTEHSAIRPIHRSEGARIQNRCLHHFVGIARFSLIFNAMGKKGEICQELISSLRQSSRLTKKSVRADNAVRS